MKILATLVAFALVAVILGMGTAALTDELGWIGFYTGVFTLLSFIVEGDAGPLTQLAAVGGILVAFGYLVYEWYATSPLFLF